MFAVTNIDDMLVLAVFFGQTRGSRAVAIRVVLGQYVGFGAILGVSVIGALGADLLPDKAIPYLGLLPLLLGLRAAWTVWKHRNSDDDPPRAKDAGILQVAMVTFANGGDNIGVYVPVFAVAGVAGMLGYVVVFLIGVAVWCAIGWYLASRPVVAKSLSRWGHLILPIVLIGIGVTILVRGGALS
ncbi:cadmium resistance transporter [Kribbella sp.]|uniref:cadmium resistance transporter n=1 Tax=Kribbella sp. TaxID=1871183 RepID=UPI0039C9106F